MFLPAFNYFTLHRTKKNSLIILRRFSKRSMESSVIHVVAYVRHRKVFASLHMELRKNGKPKLFLKVLPNHQPNLRNNFQQNFQRRTEW